MGVKYIRGGALKYRSNPKDYQGQYEAYQWIRDLEKDYKFTFVNEVFDVNAYLDNSDIIGMLQIGSRNMHNTEMMKALNATKALTNPVYNIYKAPIMLKRHYAASLNEFLNHADYLEGNVILCLRGTMGLWPSEQRFVPDVTDIARLRDMMKERGKHYRICYDVSHSGCDRRYIKDLVKCAKVYQPDFLMIEVHPNPVEALSDANQQIDLMTFKEWKEEGLFDD